MNQIPRRDRYAEEEDRIREIVGQHPVPSFVTGFQVRLGDIDGDPAVWIVFKTIRDAEPEGEELERQVAQRSALRNAVHSELLDALDNRYPYIRFEPV